MLEIPASKDTDAEDVVWGLQTADTLWKRGERIDALVWLRRAAQAAGDANDDGRALELARYAAELTEIIASMPVPAEAEAADEAPIDIDVVASVAPPVPTAMGPADAYAAADEAQSGTPSVLPAERVHAGMFDPWAEQPAADLAAARIAESAHVDDDDVVTSLRPETLSRPDAEPTLIGVPPPGLPPAAPPVPPRAAPPAPAAAPPRAAPPAPRAAPPAPPRTVPPAAPPAPRTAAPAAPSAPRAAPPAPPSSSSTLRAFVPPPPSSSSTLRASVPPPPEPPPPLVAPPPAASGLPAPAPPPPRPAGAAPPPPARPAPRARLPLPKPPPSAPVVADPKPASSPPPPPAPAAPAPASAPPPPAPASTPPPPPAAPRIDLDAVEAFADLPDDVRAAFAEAAVLHPLAEGEEVGSFALAYVVTGVFDVAATVIDAPAVRLEEGAVLRARGTTDEGVSMRLICAAGEGVVATWPSSTVDDVFRTCPWVEDDLREAADRVQTLVGITIGPLGERLDMAIREQIVERLTMRPLSPGEIVVQRGEPVPGLLLVGVGEIELVSDDEVTGAVGSGDFLFATEVLSAGAAPATARAGRGGALVMFGDRAVAQELLVTCPPLLEVFAGM